MEKMEKHNSDQLPHYAFEKPTETVIAIDINKISPNPFQPRRQIEPDTIEELADSIKACGLIQPVVVRRRDNGYQLVVGERRLLACRKLGWQKIAAAIKTLSDRDMATLALIENLQREDLNYIEEALGYQSLMQNFNLTQENLAQRLGKSQSTIANKIRILKLGNTIRSKLLENNLSERHARALLRLENEKMQANMVDEIVERGLTVNQTENRIEKINEAKTKQERLNRSKPVIRDMRIVLNTIREALSIIQKSGFYPEIEETIEPDFLEVRIRLTSDMVQADKK